MNARFKERLEAERRKQEEEKKNELGNAYLTALVNQDFSNGNGWHNRPPEAPGSEAVRPTVDATRIPPNWEFKPEDVPDVYDTSPADEQLTNAIKHLSVTQAYRMFIGKGEPKFQYPGQTESIMIRCPFPDHHDENPSAWCNTDKNTWVCAKCAYGGDVYDLAAISFGYQVPGYKKNGQFPNLRRDMARALGIQMVTGLNGQEYLVNSGTSHTPQPSATASPSAQIPPQAPAPLASNGQHRAFQIPGFQSVKVTTAVSSDEPQHASVADSAPASLPQESPAVHPVAPAQTAPPQVVVPPPAPEQTAPIHPVFNIPGVQSVQLGAPPAAPTESTQVQPAAPQVLVPPPPPVLMPVMQVTEPDSALLNRYGLDAQGDDNGDSGFTGIKLDWAQITPDDTFLGKYMNLTTRSFPPEEYHYFSGLAALSLAVGHDVTLFDSTPVKANFNVCLLGPSGDGKSVAQRYLTDLVDLALPHDYSDPFSKGVKRVSNPASAEYLVKEFVKNIEDPNNPKKSIGVMPVRGVVDFAELATLMKRANQSGSTLTQFLIQFFDGSESVRTGSITNGSDVAKNPFATVVSTTQPKALREILTQELIDNGFINRWVFATGQAKPRAPIGGEIIHVDPLVPSLKDVFGWAGQLGSTKPFVVQWSPAARDAAVDFINSVIYPAQKRDSSGLAARADLYFKKMVLLHTINLQRQIVPIEAVQWAIAMHTYMTATYDTLDKAVHHNMNAELRDAVIKAILSLHKKNGRPPSLTQIGTSVGHRRYSDKQVLECIQAMLKLGYLDEVPPGAGPGRKVMRYSLVDGE